MSRKGILLAGGSGSRLHPATQVMSKQLLPVYDKPMIYYPLSLLMHAEIRDILVITTPDDHNAFRVLLGNGSQWGLNICYEEQEKPGGIAEALIIGGKFLANEPVCLVLGDNILHGPDVPGLMKTKSDCINATVFAIEVSDPWRYGVVQFDAFNRPEQIVEKPASPPSNWAVPGIYFLPADAPQCAAELNRSLRGELEITDVNNAYMDAGMGTAMDVCRLSRGTAWLDAGTPEALLAASQYVQTIQERQGIQIACLEEIAYYKNWITVDALRAAIAGKADNGYHKYINKLVDTHMKMERAGGTRRPDPEAEPTVRHAHESCTPRLQAEGSGDVCDT